MCKQHWLLHCFWWPGGVLVASYISLQKYHLMTNVKNMEKYTTAQMAKLPSFAFHHSVLAPHTRPMQQRWRTQTLLYSNVQATVYPNTSRDKKSSTELVTPDWLSQKNMNKFRIAVIWRRGRSCRTNELLNAQSLGQCIHPERDDCKQVLSDSFRTFLVPFSHL